MVTTTLPWTWRPACSATASRISSIGNLAAMGTVIAPAMIASVIRSRASGRAAAPPVGRTPPGGLGPAAIVEIRSGATPSARAASAASMPNRSVAALNPSGASVRTRSARPGPYATGSAPRLRTNSKVPSEGGPDHPRTAKPRELHHEHAHTSRCAIFTPARYEFATRRRAVIAANHELHEREALKWLRLIATMTDALTRQGVPELAARVAAQLGALALTIAYERWSSQT